MTTSTKSEAQTDKVIYKSDIQLSQKRKRENMQSIIFEKMKTFKV